MLLCHHDRGAIPPDVKHSSVNDISEGPLRIVRNRGTEGGVVVASAEEPTLTAGQGGELTELAELEIDPIVPH